MGGDVGRAFKETLSLEELNLANCGGYKLKGLRVARLSGTKSTTAPIACRALPSAMSRSKCYFLWWNSKELLGSYTSNKISKN